MTLTAPEFDVLASARDRLAASAARSAGAANQPTRAQIVAETAAALGCSTQTVYRKLQQAGYDSGRKQRSDARRSKLPSEQLHLLAGVLRASTNNRGQRMPVADALDILHAQGALAERVSESTAARQLYARRMHPEQLALPTPSVQLRSLHPNHVWQADSTTGAYYYMPGGRLRWMPEDEYYKNKVQNIVRASSDLLTRYACTDHTTGAFKCRYYMGGETALNLLDFLTWAMWRQDGVPMQGVPLVLMLDPGAANRSHVVVTFCRRLGIDIRHHAAGAARVTGAVEKTHDLVRMHFETRLRFADPSKVTLDTLNAELGAWTAAYCATRTHSRHKRTRYSAWMEIQPEQLRVAASLEALRDAAVKEPEQRRVSNTRTIPFAGREYDLALVPGVVAGLKVTVAENPFRAPAVDVLFVCPDTGAESWHVVEPMKVDEWGYREGAPVIGREMQSAAYSDVDRARGAHTREAYRTGDGLPTLQEAAKARKAHAQAYAGIVDAMADVKATVVPTFLPRRTTPLDAAARRVEAPRLPVLEACRRLKERLGALYSPQVYAHVQAIYGSGVPELELDAIAELFAPPAAAAAAPLQAINGGAAS